MEWATTMARWAGGPATVADEPAVDRADEPKISQHSHEKKDDPVGCVGDDGRHGPDAYEPGVDRAGEADMSPMSRGYARDVIDGELTPAAVDDHPDGTPEEIPVDRAGHPGPTVFRGEAGQAPDHAPSLEAQGGRRRRRGKLDLARAFRVVELTRRGMGQAEVARSVGVARSTFQLWLARGRAGEPGFVEFVAAIRQAERDHAAAR